MNSTLLLVTCPEYENVRKELFEIARTKIVNMLVINLLYC